MKISRFFSAATLGLALTFTLSCSSDDGGGDGNKGKSYGPGCWVSEDKCAEYKDGRMDEKRCERMGTKFEPGGCPTNWKSKCEIDAGAGSNAVYYYDDVLEGEYPAGVTCTKK